MSHIYVCGVGDTRVWRRRGRRFFFLVILFNHDLSITMADGPVRCALDTDNQADFVMVKKMVVAKLDNIHLLNINSDPTCIDSVPTKDISYMITIQSI